MIPEYMRDCYKKEFETKVVSVKDGKFVVLDDTIFYPQSGGQPFDSGRFFRGADEFSVVFVGKFGGEISHEVDREGLQAGDSVRCVIDWERRHIFMRYHTAAHVISGVIHEMSGALITGNQLGLDKSRIDFNSERFDPAMIADIEGKANDVVGNGLPVTTRVISRAEALSMPELSKLAAGLPEAVTEVRVVDINGFDMQACGGTHVMNTSEIGRIRIIKSENKGKDNKRLYFELS